MAITRTPIIDDDGSGTTGTPLDNAWKQELYNQIDAADAGIVTQIGGTWTDIPYAAGNFYSNAGTWTVEAADVTCLRYTLIGKTGVVTWLLVNTSVAGSPGILYFTFPAALMPAKDGGTTALYYEGGWKPAGTQVQAGVARVLIFPTLTSTFINTTNTTMVMGTIVFSVI
jgi:hypothetical protein